MTDMAAASTSPVDFESAIRTANQQFMNAFRKRDAAGVASLYARRALLFPPGAEITEGTDAIARFWKGAIDMGITDVRLQTLSVEPFGTPVAASCVTAIEVGNYTLFAGSTAADTGKYLVVWRLEDGRWKLHRDIWNTNKATVNS